MDKNWWTPEEKKDCLSVFLLIVGSGEAVRWEQPQKSRYRIDKGRIKPVKPRIGNMRSKSPTQNPYAYSVPTQV